MEETHNWKWPKITTNLGKISKLILL
jgi:hypothetical protein